MKSSRRFFLITLIGVLPLGISAQEKLTFKDAVKIGLENNLALNQEENLLMASHVDKTSSMFGMGPSLSVNGNAGRNDGNSFNQQQGQVVNGVVDFIGANLNASMPLFNGLNNVNAFRSSTHQYDAQLHFVSRTTQDVITNISNQFLTCLLDQQLLFIQEKNVESQQQQYDQIKEQVAAGSRAEVDLLNQEYQVKNAELLLLRAGIVLKNDKAMLAQTLQLDPIIQFSLQEPDWDINLVDAETLSAETLYEVASSKRGDLARARAIEKASSLDYQATKSNYYPSLDLFAQYGSRYNYVHHAEGFSPTNRTFEEQFVKDNTQFTYGIAFTIPIFTGLQNRSTVVRSKMTYENAKLSKANMETTVKSDVLRAYQNYKDARLSFEASSAQLKAAQITYNLEKERYSLGISDIVALTQATQNHTQAQADYASSRYTLMFQKLLINYAAGTLKFEDIP